MKKKKLLYHSNHCKAFTGFGKNAKNILKYLHKTGKYEIVEASNGIVFGDPKLEKMPWKTIGTIPKDPQVQQEWNRDPGKGRLMAYGGALIDQIIKEEKPDIYLGVEDIWAFNTFWDKKWWNKVNCMVWTTLDSLPILPEAVAAAPKIKNYYVWASFAETALNKLGHDHVKTLRGSLDTDIFKRLPDEHRNQLRTNYNLSKDDFIIGFVFRNQLRKSVPNILDGFKLFLEKEPNSNAKLLLHTHWGEGWDIPRLLNEKDIAPENILTTYFCQKCQSYEIKPFMGQGQNCRFCGGEKTQNTTNVGSGVSDEQLNEVYNLMDVYCHPFTSGGQEIPVQEAKLTELITLVTNYSCGEDSCSPESGGLPLDWAEYREPGTQFIKASTSATSILRQLSKVYKMKDAKKRSLEKKSRKWVLDNFSIPVIGSKLEEILDKMPAIDWDFDFKEPLRDTKYTPPPIESDSEWIIDIYANVLRMTVDENDQGHKHWMAALAQGKTRDTILDFFHQTAAKENEEIDKESKQKDLQELIDDDKEKRLIVVMPGTIGDVYMSTSILPSLAKLYPEYAIYYSTKPEYFDILNGNPYIHKVLPFHEQFNDLLYLEGRGDHPGFFDIAFLPTIGTQRMFNYQHNAQDRIEFDLCTS
tara:strand:- start:1401 stop:3320 length:1920 start_codon:yes stop_codon:yes gene_type:complete